MVLSRVDLSCNHLDSLEDADYAKCLSEFGRIATFVFAKRILVSRSLAWSVSA